MSSAAQKWKLAIATQVLLGLVLNAYAQEPSAPSDKPKPAGRSVPALSDDATQAANGEDPLAKWNPDTMPITGLQSPTIGNQGFRHSYLVPGLQFGSMILDQPPGSGPSQDWYANNFLGANLSLSKNWSRSQLLLNYSAGGLITNGPGQNNGWYQQLAFSQNFNWRRWQMQILDQFSYLPETQFGFGAGTGLGSPGISGPLGPSVPGIGGFVSPNQSAFASVGPRYSNSFVTQVTYQTSRRGSITVGGSTGLLRFTQAGNIDSNNYVGNIGYNYLLSKVDSFGFFYRFQAYHYDGNPQAIGDHTLNFVYGRKIAKSLALQITGGPDITDYRVPLGTQKRATSGSGGISLIHAFQRGSLSANYFHGITSGSGILTGANTDQVSFSGTKQLGRVWSVQGNVGYSKNRQLSSGGIPSSDFDSVFVGGGFGRLINRNFDWSLAYQAQIQKQNTNNCSGSLCNTSYTRNVVTINLQWHSRPFVLE
jgi:hypothetical protein